MEQEVFYCPICKIATRHILLNMKSQVASSHKNQRCEFLLGKGFKLFLQTTAVASDLVGLTKIGRSLSNHNPINVLNVATQDTLRQMASMKSQLNGKIYPTKLR